MLVNIRGNKMKANNIGENNRVVLQQSLRDNPNEKQSRLDLLGLTNIFTRSIPVSQTGFYDLGFDPDFSIDGNFFYEKRYSFSIRLLIKKIIKTIVRYTYFFKTSEREASQEKTFQELVEIEKNWQKAAQADGMLYAVDKNDLNKAFWQMKAPFICELQEHLFLKKLSEIKGSASAKNVYARELLLPLHKFNRPQVPSSQSKEHIFQGAENGDVGRLSQWGFVLLDNHHTKEYKNFYIKHNDFLHTIDRAGVQLKHSMRDLRTAIREEDYDAFDEKLRVFNNCWNQYVESHQLLKDLSFIYSQKNFFDSTYQGLEKLYKKMQDPDVYKNKELYSELNEEFQKILGDKSEEGSKQLYDTFLSKLPNSLTTKRKILEKRELAFLKRASDQLSFKFKN